MTGEAVESPQTAFRLTRQRLALATCGDRLDGAEVYRVCRPRLLRFVRRLAAERGISEAQLDTEGVVHDVFEQMLMHADTIHDPQRWLYRVARRQIRRAQERLHLHLRADGDPTDHLDEDRGDGRWTSLPARASTEDVYAVRAVLDAIAELPSRQRTATYLRQIEGWSLTEIGDHLNCATTTAGVHVHRGTRWLRSQGGGDPGWISWNCDSFGGMDAFSQGMLGGGLVLLSDMKRC